MKGERRACRLTTRDGESEKLRVSGDRVRGRPRTGTAQHATRIKNGRLGGKENTQGAPFVDATPAVSLCSSFARNIKTNFAIDCVTLYMY
ncbi:hypothetical protein AAFF_G00025220 [Aldrovandia affinis]|uniref:Uncharacterized protein n=1 Tax=Aldrovandia affinis TaxID=143900 RepID=A0AAD7S4T6_9TELE|nr:hypothetical protein AAFF_G00025220 [Aldrovandia affinis]